MGNVKKGGDLFKSILSKVDKIKKKEKSGRIHLSRSSRRPPPTKVDKQEDLSILNVGETSRDGSCVVYGDGPESPQQDIDDILNCGGGNDDGTMVVHSSSGSIPRLGTMAGRRFCSTMKRSQEDTKNKDTQNKSLVSICKSMTKRDVSFTVFGAILGFVLGFIFSKAL